jgi:hypothetical protein
MNRNLRTTSFSSLLAGVGLSLLGLLMTTVLGEDSAIIIRQKLAPLRDHADPHAVEIAWPYLDSPDASLREAARLAVEAQPFASWKQRALDEKSTWGSLEALQALIESCPKVEAADLSPHLCEEITSLRIDEMSEAQQLVVLQLTRAVFTRLGPVSADERAQMLDLWAHFPGPLTARARAEAVRLVGFLEKVQTR